MGASACQEPFGATRRDLLGFRVAAITASSEGEGVRLGVATVVEGRPWSHDPVSFRWFALDNATAESIAELDADGPALAEGPAPLIPTGARSLALVARIDDHEVRAVLHLAQDPATPRALGGIQVFGLPLDLEAVEPGALSLASRRALQSTSAVDHVAPGGFLRLQAVIDEEDTLVRWMHTAPGGTYLELDARTADWVAGTLRHSEDAIEVAEPGPRGPRTLLALALPEARDTANAWAAREIWVGEPPRGVWTASGRFLPTDAQVDSPYVRGTLIADDDAPTGLALQDVEPTFTPEDPGTEALPCAVPVEGPFDPDWMLAQRCARHDVLGARVVVVLR
ncbi:MAG: hypothetical protein EA397_06725 [Deltaproteobacteria bacterium]|nr:MAG: hypothetical protein EA397_06725 [Deltaproteobacteria bacterium]